MVGSSKHQVAIGRLSLAQSVSTVWQFFVNKDLCINYTHVWCLCMSSQHLRAAFVHSNHMDMLFDAATGQILTSRFSQKLKNCVIHFSYGLNTFLPSSLPWLTSNLYIQTRFIQLFFTRTCIKCLNCFIKEATQQKYMLWSKQSHCATLQPYLFHFLASPSTFYIQPQVYCPIATTSWAAPTPARKESLVTGVT